MSGGHQPTQAVQKKEATVMSISGMAIGDKRRVAINANDADGKPAGVQWVEQTIVSEVSLQTVTRPDRRTGLPVNYTNPMGGVIAQHPVTKEIYLRPMENLQFSVPAPKDRAIVGLDVDAKGNPITIEALYALVSEANAKRVATQGTTATAATVTL